MIRFVNRDAEIGLIDDAFHALKNYKEELVRTPIVDFYGVNGIGKTAILQQAAKRCQDEGLRHILIDASQSTRQVAQDLLREAQHYRAEIAGDGQVANPQREAQVAMRELLKQGALVLLLDAVDASNQEQVRWIETLLRDVIEENKVFVALTSKRGLLFEHERSVSRKLSTVHVQPFNRRSCTLYLEQNASKLSVEARDSIFEWTQGYPLAMQVMMQSMLEQQLDPHKAEDQRPLLDKIMEQVVEQGVLAGVTQETEREESRSALALLSIPRRFNLMLMQELIERFEPEKLRRQSSLAYMGLPKKINQATNVLNWNVMRAGYAVEAPIRTIFLLKNRIEQPERYVAIQRFLALRNRQFAEEVSGSDRLRYLCEYLYHSAQTESAQALTEIIKETVQRIIQEPLSLFQQFFEEFRQDQNLRETLGEQTKLVYSLLYQHLAQEHRRSARTTSGAEHIQNLRDFFTYFLKDATITDVQAALAQQVAEILLEEPADQRAGFAGELLRDEKFAASLGENAALIKTLIEEYSSLEG